MIVLRQRPEVPVRVSRAERPERFDAPPTFAKGGESPAPPTGQSHDGLAAGHSAEVAAFDRDPAPHLDGTTTWFLADGLVLRTLERPVAETIVQRLGESTIPHARETLWAELCGVAPLAWLGELAAAPDAPSSFVVASFARRMDGLTVARPPLPDGFLAHLRAVAERAGSHFDTPLRRGAEVLGAMDGGLERLRTALEETRHAGFVPVQSEHRHQSLWDAVGSLSFDPEAHWRELPEDRHELLDALERKLHSAEPLLGWDVSLEALARLDWAAARRVALRRTRTGSPTHAAVSRFESSEQMLEAMTAAGLVQGDGPAGISALDTAKRHGVATEFLEKAQGRYGYDTPLRCLAERAGMSEARFDDARPGVEPTAVGYLAGRRFEVDIDAVGYVDVPPLLSLLNRMADEVGIGKRFVQVAHARDEHACILTATPTVLKRAARDGLIVA